MCLWHVPEPHEGRSCIFFILTVCFSKAVEHPKEAIPTLIQLGSQTSDEEQSGSPRVKFVLPKAIPVNLNLPISFTFDMGKSLSLTNVSMTIITNNFVHDDSNRWLLLRISGALTHLGLCISAPFKEKRFSLAAVESTYWLRQVNLLTGDL